MELDKLDRLKNKRQGNKITKVLLVTYIESTDEASSKFLQSYLDNNFSDYDDIKFDYLILGDDEWEDIHRYEASYLELCNFINSYDKIIYSGGWIINLLHPDNLDEDGKAYGINYCIDYGITIYNEDIKVEDYGVTEGFSYITTQGKINNFYFEILNILGKNRFVESSPVKTIEPHFYKISEFKRIFNTKWGKDENLGFDFETRGFPFSQNFRMLGFALCNDNFQASFYFDRDDEVYKEELELYGEELCDILEANQSRLWVFNSNMENNVIFHVFNRRVFFQDTEVFTYILKTRGSLKYSASLFLNVPIWNEDINVYIDAYKEFEKYLMDKHSRLIKSYFKHLDSSNISDVQNAIEENNRVFLINFMNVELSEVEKRDSEHLNFEIEENTLASGEVTFELRADFYDIARDHYDDQKYINQILKDLKNQDEPLYSLPKLFTEFEDPIDKPYTFTQLFNFYCKGYNSWQVVPTGAMFYYCQLDSYYTIKIKDCIYDVNFQGLKDGYPYYISQTNLRTLMESNGIAVNQDYFNTYKNWIYKDLEKNVRAVATFEPFVNYFVNRTAKATIDDMIVEKTIEVLDEITGGGKRYLNALKWIFCDYDEELIKSSFKELKKLYRNYYMTDSYRDFNSRLADNHYGDTYALHLFFRIINSDHTVGILESYSSAKKKETRKSYSDMLWNILEEFKNKVFSKIDTTPESLKKSYYSYIESASVNDIMTYINVGSTEPEEKSKFLLPILDEQMKKDYYINTLYAMTNNGCSEAFRDKILEKPYEDLVKLKQIFIKQRDSGSDKFNTNKEGFLTTFQQVDENFDKIVNNKGKGVSREDYYWMVRATLDRLAWEGNEIGSYDELPDSLKYLYHYFEILRDRKAISTVINGDLGGAQFFRTNDLMHPVANEDGKYLAYRYSVRINSLQTLRTASAFQTIAPSNDFNVCYRTRGKNRLFVHMDMSQSEARLAFAIPHEEQMVKAMRNNLDLHSYNANRIFNLGFDDEHLGEVKKQYNDLRTMSKTVTFAILYGAGMKALAIQTGRDREYVENMYSMYMDTNKKFSKYIQDSINYIKTHDGFIELPFFHHKIFVINPFHYKVKQTALNYQLQSVSSSLCCHSAWCLWEDLKKNYGIEIYIHGFIHDAIEFDMDAKDLFIVLERIKFWFKDHQWETWSIPSDYDIEIGLNKSNLSGWKITDLEDGWKKIQFSIKNIVGEFEEIEEIFKNNFQVKYIKVLEDTVPVPTKYGDDSWDYMAGGAQHLYTEEPDVYPTIHKRSYEVVIK